jgi:hypothetical protein
VFHKAQLKPTLDLTDHPLAERISEHYKACSLQNAKMSRRLAGSGRANSRGNGRDRGRGRGRGAGQGQANGQAAGICFDFQKGNFTRRDCQLSHDLGTADNTRTSRRPRHEETDEQRQARTQYNSWRKFLGPAYPPTSIYNMQRVWEGALEVLQEDDRNLKQQLARDLDSHESKCNGRAHVKALVDMRVNASNLGEYFAMSRNFLEIITHSSLLDCLAVDEYVGGIYSFIGGGNGTRAVTFFQRVCEALVTVSKDESFSVTQHASEQALIRLAVAISEILRRNQRIRLNDDLENLVNTVDNAAAIVPTVQPSITSTMVKQHVADMKAMINRAKGLVVDEDSVEQDEPRVFVASSYPRDLVVPSDRHDNDKTDITKIVIFPTREELTSDARDFLPSTDPDQPHFLTNQVERHIDINFRLYRHDVFGELKKALSRLMQAAVDDPTTLNYPKMSLGDMRVYHYAGASVSYITFDPRRGLQAQISFPQPPALRNRSIAERRAWWEDSRRLEEGSLLSFIWTQDSTVKHIFLTVMQKGTDLTEEYNLVSHQYMATIATRLTTSDHSVLETLIDVSCSRIHGVLLEYPKIIPATFVPILENLQNMQRLSRFRFSQWLLPDRHDGPTNVKTYHEIPCPVYARHPGFTFPLGVILKANADATEKSLNIDATASCTDVALIDEIAAKTELDRGQCRALIAALTREFAFIQGPPGTGKSYIGLQVMRILLAIKEKSRLGPIVVV